jgi:hypothetical protein
MLLLDGCRFAGQLSRRLGRRPVAYNLGRNAMSEEQRKEDQAQQDQAETRPTEIDDQDLDPVAGGLVNQETARPPVCVTI